MSISPIKQVYFDETATIQPLSDIKEKDTSLSELSFNQKKEKTIELENTSSEAKETDSSLWNSFFSWLRQSNKSPVPTENSSTHLNKPISPIPDLDKPDMPSDLNLLPPSSHLNSKHYLPISDLETGLAKMSPQTLQSLESILFNIYVDLMKLDEISANVLEKTIFIDFEHKKLQQKMSQDIADALAKDQRIVDFFKTPQKIAAAAIFISGLAMTAMKWGLIDPQFISAAALVNAILTGLTSLPKAFYQQRLNEDKAKQEELNHSQEYYTRRGEENIDHFMQTNENTSTLTEQMSRNIKRNNQMIKIILKK